MCHRAGASDAACDASAVSHNPHSCNIPHGPFALPWSLVSMCAARPFGAAMTSVHFVSVDRRTASFHPRMVQGADGT
jgi:hypothetical protein